MAPTQISFSDLDGYFHGQRSFGQMSTSSVEDENYRRPEVFLSRLLSSTSSESSRSEQGRSSESAVSATSSTGKGCAYLLSVLERVTDSDRSYVLTNNYENPRQRQQKCTHASAPKKRHGGGSFTLRQAMKRIRTDEQSRQDEMRRMASVAMSRTEEVTHVAQTENLNAKSIPARIQQDQFQVVMASKVGSHQTYHELASSDMGGGGRVVAVTGGSIVMAPDTPPRVQTKRVVARARCA
uniref:Uncharacterized protein n=1 Tax=Odontella aurita TaxID=265563 RepID=A0A7S4JCM4_9STRA|mmetsp:Transcript_4382/g.12255  ORF Transcript_4382/g.12255 Transcript_4382/m.12255 type:complete len:239 (+) Transcript_4382:42-758(+)